MGDTCFKSSGVVTVTFREKIIHSINVFLLCAVFFVFYRYTASKGEQKQKRARHLHGTHTKSTVIARTHKQLNCHTLVSSPLHHGHLNDFTNRTNRISRL